MDWMESIRLRYAPFALRYALFAMRYAPFAQRYALSRNT